MALTTNLISYWKFDENTGSTVSDSVGGNNGTWGGTLGSQWASGKIGSAGNFNGTDNVIDCGVASSLAFTTSAMSIFLWFNTSSVLVDSKMAGNFTNTSKGYQIGIAPSGANTTIKAELNTGGVFTTDNFVTTGGLNDGAWHYVGYTYDGANVQVYVDGIAGGAPVAATGAIVAATNNFFIGKYSGGSGIIPAMKLDELGVWSRALSTAEITQLYNGGAGLQYPFASILTASIPSVDFRIINEVIGY